MLKIKQIQLPQHRRLNEADSQLNLFARSLAVSQIKGKVKEEEDGMFMM
jgi:hypothetical protein